MKRKSTCCRQPIPLVQTQALIAPRKPRLCTATSCKLPPLFHLANCLTVSAWTFSLVRFEERNNNSTNNQNNKDALQEMWTREKKSWPRKLLKIGQNNIACRLQVSKVRMTQSVPKFRCFHGQLVRNGIHNFFRSKNPFQTLSQKPVLPDTRPRSKAPAAP